MSRLLELSSEIFKVDSESAAKKLVGTWLPMRADEFDSEPGVRNCQIIQEFVIAFMSRGRARYSDVITTAMNNDNKKIKANVTAVDLTARMNQGDPTLLACFLGGHDFTIIHDGPHYALFQAYEGKFHVFPKLNPKSEDFNVFGMGEVTVQLIIAKVKAIKALTACNEEVDAKLVKL